MSVDLGKYSQLLGDITARVQRAQTRAMLSANRQMLELYWDVGRRIDQRQQAEGWGASVIPRLATDLKNELPEIKGFSERNLKRMIRFYREYPELGSFVPQAVAQMPGTEKVPRAVAQIVDGTVNLPGALATLSLQLPWGHNSSSSRR